MNEEAHLLALIWEAIGDLISSADKQDAADALVGSFIECGHEIESLYDADGECQFLDRALSSAHENENEGAEEEDGDY